MTRSLAILMGALPLSVAALAATNGTVPEKGAPTFTKDVAPIVFKNCAVCHRAGEVAPMSLLTYSEVRPWAKSIREVVLDGRMPPWGAEGQHGEFWNDRRLTEAEKKTIVDWVSGGAREGDPRDLPPAPQFVAGWTIGTPDVVFSIPEFDVPSDGIVPYQNVLVATNFTEDKYIQAAEVHVGNRSIVHHVSVSIREPGATRPAEAGPGDSQQNRLVGYTPGQDALLLRPGVVKLIKKGAMLNFNMHYTPNGTPGKDQTSIGLVFAKGPVEKRLNTGLAATTGLDIPPGDPSYEARAVYVMKEDSHIDSVRPHMHARGKDFRYTLVFPDGTSKPLLWVPRYDFNWQMNYRFKEPIAVPRGTRVEIVGHYDNSAQNKFNPDPTQRVRHGEQTWDEMLAGYVEYTVDKENLRAETAPGTRSASTP